MIIFLDVQLIKELRVLRLLGSLKKIRTKTLALEVQTSSFLIETG